MHENAELDVFIPLLLLLVCGWLYRQLSPWNISDSSGRLFVVIILPSFFATGCVAGILNHLCSTLSSSISSGLNAVAVFAANRLPLVLSGRPVLAPNFFARSVQQSHSTRPLRPVNSHWSCTNGKMWVIWA